MTRVFVPVFVDHQQSADYRLERWEWTPAEGLVVVFANGTRRPSVHETVEDLLRATNRRVLERVREVT